MRPSPDNTASTRSMSPSDPPPWVIGSNASSRARTASAKDSGGGASIVASPGLSPVRLVASGECGGGGGGGGMGGVMRRLAASSSEASNRSSVITPDHPANPGVRDSASSSSDAVRARRSSASTRSEGCRGSRSGGRDPGEDVAGAAGATRTSSTFTGVAVDRGGAAGAWSPRSRPLTAACTIDGASASPRRASTSLVISASTGNPSAPGAAGASTSITRTRSSSRLMAVAASGNRRS